ncbi:MAG: hypothetical protein ACOYK9_00440 [Chlamydiia bacterium]
MLNGFQQPLVSGIFFRQLGSILTTKSTQSNQISVVAKAAIKSSSQDIASATCSIHPEDSIETLLDEPVIEELISLFDNASHTIRISISKLTSQEVSDALIRANRRGVKLEVFTTDLANEAVNSLIQEGIKIQLKEDISSKQLILVDNEKFIGNPLNRFKVDTSGTQSSMIFRNISSEQFEAISVIWKEISGEGIEPINYDKYRSEKALILKETISKIQKGIEEIKDPGAEEKRLIRASKELIKKLEQLAPQIAFENVPGFCFYSGDDYLKNVVMIGEKLVIVSDALSQIHQSPDQDERVTAYFNRIYDKLRSGINVPLPAFFHATEDGLEDILKTRVILQSSDGYVGPGAYISTNDEGELALNDEGELAFGPFTFAIDEDALVDTEGVYFLGNGKGSINNLYFSLWVSVLKEIPVKENTIAYISTISSEMANVREIVKRENLKLEVLEKSVSDRIHQIFDRTIRRRQMPSFKWKLVEDCSGYLPNNITPRTEKGTFTAFDYARPLGLRG